MSANRSSSSFHVVGIGASAGGIEAFQQFFRPLPPDSGHAYVVVTHLPPGRESSLVPVLAKFTPMPVLAAEDGLAVEPNRVYALSRAGTLTIVDGRLRLRNADAEHRQRFPVDIFFASLAQERGERAVGVVLSGGGTDGTLGVKAIKEYGGLTLAQGSDHTEPRHASMPTSAIATGVVDMVLPVQEMPARILSYIDGFEALGEEIAAPLGEPPPVARARDEICRILRNRVGHDFAGYKDKTFLRRVHRRMQVLQLAEIDAYIERLRQDPDEARLLFRDLLITVTNFFRDKDAFEELERSVIPRLLEGKGADNVVRVWVPGCATGEEAYSLAILLREGIDGLRGAPKVQVFATDIDEAALAVARAARYPAPLLEHVSPERLKRFFTTDAQSIAVTKEIRDLCIFSAHSLIRDPPFSRIDLVSCRNLLIYLDAELQERVIPVFHYALRPDGYLFLGTSENITRHAHLFAPLSKQHRIFQRREHATDINGLVPLLPMRTHGVPLRAGATPLEGLASTLPRSQRGGLRQQAERHLLQRFAPAYVVVDREGEVMHYSTRTGAYLEAPEGAPSRQLVAMARKGLRVDVRAALRAVVETGRPVRRDGVIVDLGERAQKLSIIVEKLPERDGEPHYVVVFQDTGPLLTREEAEGARSGDAALRHDDTVQHLEGELREVRERLQSTVEEYETALEELKSANEELVSVNEELQSTNEELETSKEEQQSINEELNTANSDLNAKVEELDRANADLKNLFESTQIATVFLDRHLVIRSFTPAVTAIFNLLPSDRGRPLTDIVHQLKDVDIRSDIRGVLEGREMIERRVHGSPPGGAHYLMRILPYRSSDNEVDGVLVTFVDVTKVVESEQHQSLLVAELNHRVRNMLAVVIGMVAQSAANQPGARAFSDRLLGRLQGLARTYGMISRDNWGPVSLRDLVEAELRAYADDDASRVSIKGAPILLAPKAALAFGMALHELATNAAKHGALSLPKGRIAVTWSAAQSDGRRRLLTLRWREADGPRVAPPNRSGFGTELLARLLGYELEGRAKIDFAADGVRAELVAPIDDELVRAPNAMPAAQGSAASDA